MSINKPNLNRILIAVLAAGIALLSFPAVSYWKIEAENKSAEHARAQLKAQIQRDHDTALTKKYLIEFDDLAGRTRTDLEQARYQELANELSLLITRTDGFNLDMIKSFTADGNAILDESIAHDAAMTAIMETQVARGR